VEFRRCQPQARDYQAKYSDGICYFKMECFHLDALLYWW
jgi:hypothetical protein